MNATGSPTPLPWKCDCSVIVGLSYNFSMETPEKKTETNLDIQITAKCGHNLVWVVLYTLIPTMFLYIYFCWIIRKSKLFLAFVG